MEKCFDDFRSASVDERNELQKALNRLEHTVRITVLFDTTERVQFALADPGFF